MLAGLVAIALTTCEARAQEEAPERIPSAELSYDASPGCIERPELEAAVSTQLGRQVFEQGGDIAVRVVVRREGQEWAVSVELARADGTALGSRRLRQRGEDCRGLDGALALVLALLLDAGDEEIVVEAPEPPPRPAPPIERPPPIEAPSEPRIALMLGLGASIGRLPSVSPLAEVRVDVDLVDLVALVFRTHGSPPFAYDAEGASARAGYWVLGSGLRLDLIEADPVGVSATGVLDVGAVFGEGVGLDPSRSFVGAEVVGELALELRIRAGSAASIVAGLGLGFPFFAAGFSILENGRELLVFTPSILWGAARAGLVIALGS
jgi:hypothetical protein